MRIQHERSMSRFVAVNDDEREAAERLAREVRALVLEDAVLANAEGWQSGSLAWDTLTSEAALDGPVLTIRAWMDMTPGRDAVPEWFDAWAT